MWLSSCGWGNVTRSFRIVTSIYPCHTRSHNRSPFPILLQIISSLELLLRVPCVHIQVPRRYGRHTTLKIIGTSLLHLKHHLQISVKERDKQQKVRCATVAGDLARDAPATKARATTLSPTRTSTDPVSSRLDDRHFP